MKSIRFGRAGCMLAANVGHFRLRLCPPGELAAAKAQVAPSAALTPALRNSIVEVIMKLDSGQIWPFGKPNYEYAHISNLMFSRPLTGTMTGTAEVDPYYCVELGGPRVGKPVCSILVQRTETGYRLNAKRNKRFPICYIPPGQAQDFPELLARKNAPSDS